MSKRGVHGADLLSGVPDYRVCSCRGCASSPGAADPRRRSYTPQKFVDFQHDVKRRSPPRWNESGHRRAEPQCAQALHVGECRGCPRSCGPCGEVGDRRRRCIHCLRPKPAPSRHCSACLRGPAGSRGVVEPPPGCCRRSSSFPRPPRRQGQRRRWRCSRTARASSTLSMACSAAWTSWCCTVCVCVCVCV